MLKINATGGTNDYTQLINTPKISGINLTSTSTYASLELPHLSGDGTNTSLDIMDDVGNVILRLANGHIQTKYFNSTELPTNLSDLVNDTGFLTEMQISALTSLKWGGKSYPGVSSGIPTYVMGITSLDGTPFYYTRTEAFHTLVPSEYGETLPASGTEG